MSDTIIIEHLTMRLSPKGDIWLDTDRLRELTGSETACEVRYFAYEPPCWAKRHPGAASTIDTFHEFGRSEAERREALINLEDAETLCLDPYEVADTEPSPAPDAKWFEECEL